MMSASPHNAVTVNDVGPRDGLQNQPKILTPAERVKLVKALLGAGMTHVEVGAFVSPKAVPAMAGADEVGVMNWPPPPGRRVFAWCFTAVMPWRRPTPA
jgi:hypothetical protein